MFERFTDRARRVLVLAQEESRRLEHSFIGTEHLLLGLLAEEDGIGARALVACGVTLGAARDRVAAIIGGPLSGAGRGTHIPSPPFTPRAKKVLELSLRETLQLGHHDIGTEHLLLGLLREGEGVACQVIVGLGVDLRKVRAEALTMMGGAEAAGNEPPIGAPVVARSEEGRWLRADIQASLESGPGVAVLRRYLAGECTPEELAGGTVTQALADAVLSQQELLRRLADRLLPGS